MTAQAATEFRSPFPLRPLIVGMVTALLFVAGFGAWSITAPLQGAVVSSGILVVATSRKQIQHLEGGIVEQILVNDGDKVVKDQLLIKLNDVRAATQLKQLERQYREAQAVVARLAALRDGKRKITFPEDLLAYVDTHPELQSIMDEQRNILRALRSVGQDKKSVTLQKIAQTEEQIKGLKAQLQTKLRQKEQLETEQERIRVALEKNIVPAAEGYKLAKELAEVDIDISAYESDIDRLNQNVLELRLQINEGQAQILATVSDELRNAQAQLFALTQQMTSAQDVVTRTEVRSPIDGVVVNMKVHTLDGVIDAGQTIMEIVPVTDELVINAYIDPRDIDEVAVGMNADIRLSAISNRRQIPLTGKVSAVSADRLADSQTGYEYFLARIELQGGGPELAQANLVPGMGVDVFIQTGARTPLEYLVSPLMENIRAGMREN